MPTPLLSGLPSIDHLAVIAVSGADASTFLQGQLSNDLALLSASHTLLASCNSAQGRVQAVLTLIQRQDGVLVVLPQGMVDAIMLRLRKYVLRAKVSLVDARGQWRAYSASAADLSASNIPAPIVLAEHREHEGLSIVRWRDAGERYLVIGPAGNAAANDASEAWRLADIRAGLAQIYPQTHEAFVAQMLNLDLVDGISFEKGCYTGQEIIARAHFRGSVKRRMFRFRAHSTPPAPGTKVLVGEIHAGDVVDAAATPEGCEMLAVISLGQLDQPLVTQHAIDMPLQRLELPYEVES